MLCKFFTGASKEGLGHSLKRVHCKRDLVPSRKQVVHKLFGTKSSLSSHKRVPRPLLRQDSPCSNRQHNSGVVHKQVRRHEVRPNLCSTVENLDLVFQITSDSKSPTHSRPAECGSRQAIPARTDHPDRVVSPSRGLPDNMQQVALARNRPICHEVQQQVTSVCVTGTGSSGLSSGCTQSAMGGSGRICLPTSSHLGQKVDKLQDCPCKRIVLIDPGWPNMPWFLGSSDNVQPNPTESTQPAQPINTAL